jgi:hypothetical protein
MAIGPIVCSGGTWGAELRKTTNDLSDALDGGRHGTYTEEENLMAD